METGKLVYGIVANGEFITVADSLSSRHRLDTSTATGSLQSGFRDLRCLLIKVLEVFEAFQQTAYGIFLCAYL